MNKFFFTLVLLLSFSCTLAPRHGSAGHDSVDVGDNEYQSKVEVDAEQGQDIYGPEFTGTTSGTAQAKKVLGLTFHAAGYLSIGYLGVLRKLEQEGTRPNILVCPELAGLICLLYAKYKDSNRVEFEIFSMISKLKGPEYYSKQWRETLLELIEDNFDGTRLEQLDLIVGIPVKVGATKIKVLSHGKIVDIMANALKLSGDYPTSIITEKYINFGQFYKNRGADLVHEVAIAPNAKLLEINNGYLLGVYSKHIFSTKSVLAPRNQVITLDKTLDSNDDLLSIVGLVFDKSDYVFQRIKAEMQAVQ